MYAVRKYLILFQWNRSMKAKSSYPPIQLHHYSLFFLSESSSSAFFAHHFAWKMSKCGVFVVRIFLHWDWIRRFTESISVFSPNAEKYGPEMTRYAFGHFLCSATLWCLENPRKALALHYILENAVIEKTNNLWKHFN